HRGAEVGPGDIVYLGTAAQVRAEDDIGQVEDDRVGAHLGRTELEVDVRCIDIAGVLQRKAIKPLVARVHDAGAAQANADVRLQSLFHQVPIGSIRLLAAGVDDRHVVETVRSAPQVED